MGKLALALLLAAAASSKEATKDEVALAKYFINTPTGDLDPQFIEPFFALDVESLPRKLRKKVEGKRFELRTLQSLSEGKKKKGLFRVPQEDCSRLKELESQDIQILKFAGYDEIDADEEKYVEAKSQCTEKELMCEFSLQVVLTGKKKQEKRFFLHEKDPVMGHVAEYRAGHKGGQTNFFGAMKGMCPK